MARNVNFNIGLLSLNTDALGSLQSTVGASHLSGASSAVLFSYCAHTLLSTNAYISTGKKPVLRSEMR